MKTATKIGVAVFTLVALAHLYRVVMGFEVTVGDWNAPMWVSYLGVVIPGALAFFIYKEHQ